MRYETLALACWCLSDMGPSSPVSPNCTLPGALTTERNPILQVLLSSLSIISVTVISITSITVTIELVRLLYTISWPRSRHAHGSVATSLRSQVSPLRSPSLLTCSLIES